MARRKRQESVPDLALRALKEAVRDLIKERAKTNDSLVVWKNGKVVRVSARKLV